MQSPLQITFRHMETSPALEVQIRRRAAELDRLYGRIIGCHVVVECQHRHPHQGKLFEVRVELTLPGAEIAIGRDPGNNHAHEDAHVAVRDAFDAARRRVEGRVQRLHQAEHLQGAAHETAPARRG